MKALEIAETERRVGPHVANPDREKDASRRDRGTMLERHAKVVVVQMVHARYGRVEQLNAHALAFVAAALAQLRRARLVVDEHGQRDASELITDDRQELSHPQSPELRHREHVAEPRLRGLLGQTPPGHRVSSYLALRLSGPLRSSVITS